MKYVDVTLNGVSRFGDDVFPDILTKTEKLQHFTAHIFVNKFMDNEISYSFFEVDYE